MSKVDKLSLQGIRAFHPNTPEVIQFNTPLTLIVGMNGSGKTTIIEALLYATTGELPPNSKGGAFVHDPALISATSIPAQVKLSFYSTIREKLVVTRNLEVTVKKDKGKLTRAFKTKEATIKILNGTETHTTSSKVAELETAIPRHLGVSKAVLDCVIFCHQDESLWPMSEPAELKKKFDKIFEADKYTKAIDALKKLKVAKGTELKLLKNDLKHDKDNKERGERAEKKMIALQAEIEAGRERGRSMKVDLDKLSAAVNAKKIEASTFLVILDTLNIKYESRNGLQNTITDLEKSIEVRTESDSWLQNNLAEHEERVALLKQQLENKGIRFKQLKDESAAAQKSLQEKNKEQGQRQADQEAYEKRVDLRGTMIQEAAGRHEIRGYDGDVNDRQALEFSKRIQKVFEDRQRALERLKKDNQKDNDEKQDAINDMDTKKNGHIQQRKFAKDRTADIDKLTTKLQKDVTMLNFDPSVQVQLESRLKDSEAYLKKASDDFNSSDYDARIQDERGIHDRLESESNRLSQELSECIRFAKDGAELSVQKKLLTEKKRKLESLKSTWNGKLSAVLGASWDPSIVEAKFQAAIKDEISEVDQAKVQQRAKQDDLQKIEFRLSDLQEKLKQAEKDVKRCQTSVLRALIATKGDEEKEGDEEKVEDLTMDSYLPRMEQFEDELRGAESDLALCDKLKDYYIKAKKYLNITNKCSMCDRKFDGEAAEKAKLQKKIEKNLDEQVKEGIEKDMDKIEEKLDQLRSVRSSYDTFARTEKEIPSLKQKLSFEETAKLAAVRSLEQHDATVQEAQEKLQDLEALNKTVLDISSTHNEIHDAEQKIERIASQQQSGGQLRSVDEVQELQATCTEQLKASNDKLDKLKNDRQRKRDEVNNLDGDIRDLRHQIKNAQGQSEKNANLISQIQSLKDESAKQRIAMNEADAALGALEPEIAEKKSQQQHALRQGRIKEKTAEDEMSKVHESVKELKRIERDINDYLDGGGPAKLAAVEQQIAEVQKKVAILAKDSDLVAAEINKLRTEETNSSQTKRNIQDNLRYRKKRSELHDLEQEISNLESRHASDDHKRLTEEVEALENEHNLIAAERQGILGQMTAKDIQLGEDVGIYEQEYINAKPKYQETLIKHRTTLAAEKDIDTYATALDSAIMSYHTKKMQEINQIIGELWSTTYQGTDIDTILIKSDGEGTGKRNYNYRVSMVKQDTELDMRGRCSAGQRVLASIIIRLALAESFGVNCGLIALDEPTTNLDEANIRSLAISLHAIIKARQAQSNFQLIVITHDEQFLRNMQCAEFCDTFYRVSRDEKQNSVINRVSINRLIDA